MNIVKRIWTRVQPTVMAKSGPAGPRITTTTTYISASSSFWAKTHFVSLGWAKNVCFSNSPRKSYIHTRAQTHIYSIRQQWHIPNLTYILFTQRLRTSAHERLALSPTLILSYFLSNWFLYFPYFYGKIKYVCERASEWANSALDTHTQHIIRKCMSIHRYT